MTQAAAVEASCCGRAPCSPSAARGARGRVSRVPRGLGRVVAVAACLCAGSKGASGTENELEPSRTCCRVKQELSQARGGTERHCGIFPSF